MAPKTAYIIITKIKKQVKQFKARQQKMTSKNMKENVAQLQ